MEGAEESSVGGMNRMTLMMLDMERFTITQEQEILGIIHIRISEVFPVKLWEYLIHPIIKLEDILHQQTMSYIRYIAVVLLIYKGEINENYRKKIRSIHFIKFNYCF